MLSSAFLSFPDVFEPIFSRVLSSLLFFSLFSFDQSLLGNSKTFF